MTKRLVEIDDDLLEEAREATGQTTIKGTVDAALREIVRRALFRRHLELLSTPGVIEPEAVALLEAMNKPSIADDDG